MTKTIIKDETLFNHELIRDNQNKLKMELKRQKYSDGTEFYWFDDGSGILKIWLANKDLSILINQIEKMKNSVYKWFNEYKDHYEDAIQRKDQLIDWYDRILNDMKIIQ